MNAPIAMVTGNPEIVHITTDKYPVILEATQSFGSVKVLTYHPDGTATLEVPWDLFHMQLLSHYRAPAISTIFKDYRWPGLYAPMKHQIKMVDLMVRSKRCYILADMGTGKTMSALWAADFLMTQGLVKRVLVICPKTIMRSAWVDDIMKTIIHRSHAVLDGEAAKRRKKAKGTEEFHIINFDGLKVVADILKANEYDLIIADELTAFKTKSSDRWAQAAALIGPNTWVWGLTGTPTPQGPMDAHGQVMLLTPENLPPNKRQYEDMVMIRLATYILKPKRGWQEVVHNIMQPAIRVRKDECLDLPPVTNMFREVDISPGQRRMLDILRREGTVSVGEEGEYTITAENAAVAMGKYRQIVAGGIYDDTGEALDLDNKARLAEVVSIIETTKAAVDEEAAKGRPAGKTLVFAPYKHLIEIIVKHLEKKKFKVGKITGEVSGTAREAILKAFQDTHEMDVIVAVPDAFSHGVTATAASTTVWYAPPGRTEVYLQACERTARPGQTQHMNVIHLYGDKTERGYYDALINNSLSQTDLFELYKNFLGGK